MGMYKKILPIVAAGYLALTPVKSYAAENYAENFFKGVFKAGGGFIAQIVKGPEHIIRETEEKGLSGLIGGAGDVLARPFGKALDESIYAIKGQDSERSLYDPGKVNETLESNTATRIVRNTLTSVGLGFPGLVTTIIGAGTGIDELQK